ncbi:Type I restriction-modification system S subunit [Francisella tularensis subsp. tularensis 1378]|uniref:restriction endonuclease subunit S n=1 Tax=Francisella tularensis TaxID=263 RepID=UPI0003271682|nr:restriction endonuclease subunit S [Francisella tularensis]EOA46869.1 Type I restriction-modification system S subunit [Francisella tularensis subsp. tularensis 1378]
MSKANIEWVKIQDKESYPILGVRGQGQGVYINRIANGKELTMKKYQKSEPYHLFFCKVRTVKGQWGVVYPEYANSYASSNMQYLKIDLDKILPEYLEMLLKLKKITDIWDKNAIGADGRHFLLKILLTLQIPLPPIEIQKQIVQAYEDKINLANQLEQRAEKLEAKIEKYLYAKLGIEQAQEQKQDKKGLLKFVRFEQLQRWDTDFFKQKEGYSSKYETVSYEDLFVSLNNGIAARNYASDGIRYLKVSDIKDNYINNDKPFYVNKYKESDLIEKGTLLITRKGTVGNSYYLDKDGSFVASSEIFIIKLNDKVNGNYLSEINLSSFVKKQYREKSTGTIMPSLSQPKLKSILIPLPPLKIQNHIAVRIQKLKDYIKALEQQAEQNRENALRNFEVEIFSKE